MARHRFERHGERRERGTGCTASCLNGSTKRASSTGPALRWMPRPSGQEGGRRDGAEPDGSRPRGHEAALRHRPKGRAARPDAHGRGPPRQHGARINARRRAGGSVGASRATPQAPRGAARGQGLRPSPVPPGLPRPLDRTPHRAPRVETSAKLGRHRWVVERTFAWLSQFRRLATRCDRRADIHTALTKLATAIICMSQIRRFCWALLGRKSAQFTLLLLQWPLLWPEPLVQPSSPSRTPPGPEACAAFTKRRLNVRRPRISRRRRGGRHRRTSRPPWRIRAQWRSDTAVDSPPFHRTVRLGLSALRNSAGERMRSAE